MKSITNNWWSSKNESYSKLIGDEVTNGDIIKVAIGIVGFVMLTGIAQMLEDMI